MAPAAPTPTRRRRPKPRHAMAPAAQPPLPDELLEDIFLRLDAADDLARASASCASFRRIVSARGFLRRFRSLHPPPVLGFLACSHSSSSTQFYQAQPPRKWAPAARAFAQAADFTFSFLDDPDSWRVCDARDGRVLLARTTASSVIFEDFVVYDPLHRRYVQIPPIPVDQMAFAQQYPSSQLHEIYFESFLAPVAWDEEEPSLRVFCNVTSKAKVVTFVFSSVIGMWRAVASFSIETHEWMRYPQLMKRHCVHGCFYWTDDHRQTVMLVLDTLEMKFSVVDLPPESEGKWKSIVEAADGRFDLLISCDFEFRLYSKTRRYNGVVDTQEWLHVSTIPLPDCCYCWSTSDGGAAKGYVLLRGIPRYPYKLLEKKPDVQYFTMRLRTLRFERLCVLKNETTHDYLFANFPPSLSLPSI